jgi:hypothetical protein
MFRKIVSSTALTLAVGLLAVGCSDDDSDDGDESFFARVGAFSSNEVLDNNASDDAWGFSPNNYDVNLMSDDDNVVVYWNGTSGKALAVMHAEDENDREHLYISYYNGSNFESLQRVVGEDEDPDGELRGSKFMWIGSGAGNWAGYGILLFTREDQEPTQLAGTTINENSNRRLYGAIVDSSGTLLGDAAILDFDNIDADGDDEDVQTFGFVSDSLNCTHEFSGWIDGVASGDNTSAVHIVFEKDPTTASGTAVVGTRFYSLTVDLDASDPVTNGLPTGGDLLNVEFGSLDSDNGESVALNSYFLVHNNWMLWDAYVDEGEDDETVTVTFFDEAGEASNLALSESTETTNFDGVYLPDAESVFGGDHGLQAGYVFYTEEGFSDNGANGDRTSDEDLYVALLTDDDGNGDLERETQEIDLYTGTVSLEAGDADGFDPVPGTEGGIDGYSAVMTREGNIFVIMAQPSTEIDDPDDTDVAITPATDKEENTILAMCCIKTIQDAANEDRDLVDSVSTTERIDMNTATLGTGSGGQDQGDVSSVGWQNGMVQGQSGTNFLYVDILDDSDVSDYEYVNCDRDCAPPSLATDNVGDTFDTVHFYFTQWALFTAGDNDNDELHVAGGQLEDNDTFSPFSPSAPTLNLTGTIEVDAMDDDWDGYNEDHISLVDAGEADDRDVIVFYTSQSNARTSDDSTTGSYEATRLYAQYLDGDSAGAETLVSADGDDVSGREQSFEVWYDAPVFTYSNSSNNRVDAVWIERIGENWDSGQRVATRSLTLRNLDDTNGPTFADTAWTPSIEDASGDPQAPTYIDNPEDWDLDDDEWTVLHDGDRVGLFLEENDHIYYNESSNGGGGWAAAPELVDNFNADDPQDWHLLPGPDSKPLGSVIVIWEKEEPTGDDGDDRIYIRVGE